MGRNSAQLKKIWIAGTAEGAMNLRNRILDEIEKSGGKKEITDKSTNRISITWRSTEFCMTQDSTMYIIRHCGDIDPEPTEWNEALEQFFREVVQPLKDITGGVAAEIGTFKASN